MKSKLTYKQAFLKAKETSLLNDRPFKVVRVTYMNGEKGWDVTPADNPAAILGSKGGRAKSVAKGKAARANGLLGGRPRKKSETACIASGFSSTPL